MRRFIPFALFLLAGLAFSGCKKDDNPTLEDLIRQAIKRSPDQHTIDVQKIKDYLTEKNITAQSTFSGLHYTLEQVGSGEHPNLNATVTVFYKGYFLDGQVFDQTGANPISFPLRQVILGWQEGIPFFKTGGKGKLFLPSTLAYGSNPPAGIPANAVMIFDVELVGF